MVNALELDDPGVSASVAVIVNVKVPMPEGLPVITPAVLSVRPVGKMLEVTANVTPPRLPFAAVPPEAETVWLYVVTLLTWLTVHGGSEAVVISTAGWTMIVYDVTAVPPAKSVTFKSNVIVPAAGVPFNATVPIAPLVTMNPACVRPVLPALKLSTEKLVNGFVPLLTVIDLL